ncbi:hypothetical protein D5045_24200 [Verminephrobacter eiseniae]|nr:hypothetical protein [Verminephrobacter eiseniae]
MLVSRHRSDVVGCAQPSERSARRVACPYRAVLASDATPRCASMASADRQMIGDATLGTPRQWSCQAAGSPFEAGHPWSWQRSDLQGSKTAWPQRHRHGYR